MTPWTVACQVPVSSTVSEVCSNSCPLSWWHYLNYLILCHPLLLFSSVFPSIRVFSSESALHIMWPKYWSFSFNNSPSNGYSGLISDLFAVQGTLKTSPAPQLESIRSLALNLLYSPTLTSVHNYWKNHCFDKVMSLLFNMLFRFFIALLAKARVI